MWEEITYRVSGPSTKPAGISLKMFVGGDKPMCHISIRMTLSSTLGWRSKEQISVALGRGEHAGRLRIFRGGAHPIGRVRANPRGGFSVSVGHIPEFGLTPRGKIGVDAIRVDEDTVEITLPDWSSIVEEDDNTTRAIMERAKRGEPQDVSVPRREGPLAPTVEEARSAAVARVRDGDPSGPVHANGVTVRLGKEDAGVTHQGSSVELTDGQARLVAVLARGMPDPIGERHIMEKMWGRKLPSNAAQVLRQIVDSLEEDLEEVGLCVTLIKGVGYCLRTLE